MKAVVRAAIYLWICSWVSISLGYPADLQSEGGAYERFGNPGFAGGYGDQNLPPNSYNLPKGDEFKEEPDHSVNIPGVRNDQHHLAPLPNPNIEAGKNIGPSDTNPAPQLNDHVKRIEDRQEYVYYPVQPQVPNFPKNAAMKVEQGNTNSVAPFNDAAYPVASQEGNMKHLELPQAPNFPVRDQQNSLIDDVPNPPENEDFPPSVPPSDMDTKLQGPQGSNSAIDHPLFHESVPPARYVPESESDNSALEKGYGNTLDMHINQEDRNNNLSPSQARIAKAKEAPATMRNQGESDDPFANLNPAAQYPDHFNTFGNQQGVDQNPSTDPDDQGPSDLYVAPNPDEQHPDFHRLGTQQQKTPKYSNEPVPVEYEQDADNLNPTTQQVDNFDQSENNPVEQDSHPVSAVLEPDERYPVNIDQLDNQLQVVPKDPSQPSSAEKGPATQFPENPDRMDSQQEVNLHIDTFEVEHEIKPKSQYSIDLGSMNPQQQPDTETENPLPDANTSVAEKNEEIPVGGLIPESRHLVEKTQPGSQVEDDQNDLPDTGDEMEQHMGVAIASHDYPTVPWGVPKNAENADALIDNVNDSGPPQSDSEENLKTGEMSPPREFVRTPPEFVTEMPQGIKAADQSQTGDVPGTDTGYAPKTGGDKLLDKEKWTNTSENPNVQTESNVVNSSQQSVDLNHVDLNLPPAYSFGSYEVVALDGNIRSENLRNSQPLTGFNSENDTFESITEKDDTAIDEKNVDNNAVATEQPKTEVRAEEIDPPELSDDHVLPLDRSEKQPQPYPKIHVIAPYVEDGNDEEIDESLPDDIGAVGLENEFLPNSNSDLEPADAIHDEETTENPTVDSRHQTADDTGEHEVTTSSIKYNQALHSDGLHSDVNEDTTIDRVLPLDGNEDPLGSDLTTKKIAAEYHTAPSHVFRQDDSGKSRDDEHADFETTKKSSLEVTTEEAHHVNVYTDAAEENEETVTDAEIQSNWEMRVREEEQKTTDSSENLLEGLMDDTTASNDPLEQSTVEKPHDKTKFKFDLRNEILNDNGRKSDITSEKEIFVEATTSSTIMPMLTLILVVILLLMLCSKMPSFLYSTWISFGGNNGRISFLRRWNRKGYSVLRIGDKTV